MVVLAIILVLISVVILLLVIPVRLYINTYSQQYRLSWWRLVIGRIIPTDEGYLLEFHVPGYTRRYPLQELLKSMIRRPPTRQTSRHSTKKSVKRPSLRQMRALLRTFRVRELTADIDTGSWWLNTILFPASFFIRRKHMHWRINYQGRRDVVLDVSNRPYRILKTLIFSPKKR